MSKIFAQIDVPRLLGEIRAEVRGRIAASPESYQSSIHPSNGSKLLSGPPPIPQIQRAQDNLQDFQRLADEAWTKTEVKSWIPKFFRRLFRKQGAFNKHVFSMAQSLAAESRSASDRIGGIGAYLKAENEWLRSAARRDEMSRAQAEHQFRVEAEKFSHAARSMESRLLEMEEGFPAFAKAISADTKKLGEEILQTREEIGALRDNLGTEAGACEQAERRIEAQHSRLDLLGQRCDALHEGLGTEAGAREQAERTIEDQHSRLDLLGQRCDALQEGLSAEAGAREQAEREVEAQHSRLDHLGQRLDIIQAMLTRFDERQVSDSAYLRRELQLRTSSPLPQEKKAKRAGSEETSEKPSSISRSQFDAFYVAFEDHFRGTRTVIKNRVAVYLPLVRKAGAGTAEHPVLDIGCGRGEWLELLRENGFIGRGLDLNQFMVTECQERGLDVVQADVLTHLRSLPDDSVGMITGMHIIEHLPFAVLMEFLTECLRVLRAGGTIALETPNPDNVQVGSNRFYTDPTHVHPLPKEFTHFAASTAGFSEVEIIPLHPDESALSLGENSSAAERVVNEMFFGFQDYAVTGRK